MPAERSTTSSTRKASLISKNAVECDVCGKIISRAADLARHMKTHDANAKKLQCPWKGCEHSTLQKSNLDTHYRRHKGDKSFICTDHPVITPNANFGHVIVSL